MPAHLRLRPGSKAELRVGRDLLSPARPTSTPNWVWAPAHLHPPLGSALLQPAHTNPIAPQVDSSQRLNHRPLTTSGPSQAGGREGEGRDGVEGKRLGSESDIHTVRLSTSNAESALNPWDLSTEKI